MMSGPRERSGAGGMPALVGTGLLMVLGCAGPLLVAGGALIVVGGARRDPWLITVGAVMVLIPVAYVLRCRARNRGGAAPEDHCPSVPRPSDAADKGGGLLGPSEADAAHRRDVQGRVAEPGATEWGVPIDPGTRAAAQGGS